jgi:hypothetical protein
MGTYGNSDKTWNPLGSNLLSFSQIAKDLQSITNKMITNDNLCKLLYYADKNALSKPTLTDDQKYSLIGDRILVVPLVTKDDVLGSYVIVQFDQFSPNSTSEAIYREFIVTFDILVNTKIWTLDDYTLRPYAIMHEIDKMFNMSKLNSSGPINFIGANSLVISEFFMGFTLAYKVYDFR